jgi:hypothetical protein
LTLACNPSSKNHFSEQTNYTGVNLPENNLNLNYTENRNSYSKLEGNFNSQATEEQSSVNINCFQGKLDLK